MKLTDIFAVPVLFLALLSCVALTVFGYWWMKQVGFYFWAAAFSIGVPLVGSGVLTVVLWCGRTVRLAGAISVLAAVLAVLGAETYLAFSAKAGIIVGPPVPANRNDAQNGIVRAVPKIDGVSTFPSAYPAGYLDPEKKNKSKIRFRIFGKPFLPLGGMPDSTTVYCDEGYGTVVFRSDRNGFRNPNTVWDDSAVPVVAAIGDSYTMGACIDDGGSFIDRLRSTWPRIVNLGMPGNGPLLELAALKEYLAHLRPRLVLWFFCENNDYSDLARERHVPLLMRYLEDVNFSQGLLARRDELSSIVGQFLREGIRATRDRNRSNSGKGHNDPPVAPSIGINGSALTILKHIVFLRHLRSALGWFHVRVDGDVHKLYGRILNEAKRTVESWGGELVVVMVPGFSRVSGTLFETGYPEAHTQFIVRMIERHGIRVIDPAPALRQATEPIYPPNGRHFSLHGNDIIARVIIDALENR